ncbi:MAG TPA: protein kinase [Gemmataceae bacterium]|nr:protein kinase [Gemmataceae bacterium]
MDRTGDWQAIDPLETAAPTTGTLPPPDEFLLYLRESQLLPSVELEAFFEAHPDLRDADTQELTEALLRQGLLNEYQVTRLLAGQTFGLVLGNYRVVDRLGTGGMGVVYKAEHVHMKRVVALKVLFPWEDHKSVFTQRFYSEMQALAALRHPNIVLAFDAGEVKIPHAPSRVLSYLVMEYVTGENLERYVEEHGPLPIERACDFIRQVADGLQHAHEHGLVHRDIKPSNLVVTAENRVKILDFGLARLCRRRCTEAHSMLGTVEYMAPEQARDARSVDIRADIYSLGGTFYWLLTGKKPFPSDRPMLEALLARQREKPIPLRHHRPELPLELEKIVNQMMAQAPDDRFPTPQAVITALNSFLSRSRRPDLYLLTDTASAVVLPLLNGRVADGSRSYLGEHRPTPAELGQRSHRVLIVSSHASCRAHCRAALDVPSLEVAEAATAREAQDWLARTGCDLVLIDTQLPDDEGYDLCRRLRAEPPAPHLKLILLTPRLTAEGASLSQEAGADDYVCKSAPANELLTRARVALRLKESEERADRLVHHLLQTNQQLEQALKLRDNDLYQAQDVLIFAMAKMAELRGLETGGHLLRMQAYVRVLAEEAMRLPAFATAIDANFIRMLERCVLLHDIGKVAIPDHVLLKPGRLDPEERSIMESHTVLGASILEAVARQHGTCLAFLQMAIDIVHYHHERYDGTGYPAGLAGEAIPLAARIVTVADVYDALRCKLVYKPGLSHAAVRRLLLESTGQFDPALLVAFSQCEASFERIFEQTPD